MKAQYIVLPALFVAAIWLATVLVYSSIGNNKNEENQYTGHNEHALVLNDEQKTIIQNLEQQTANKMDTLILQLLLVKQQHEEQLLEVLTPEQKQRYLQRKHQKEQGLSFQL